MRCIGVLLLLAGCDQIFKLTPPDDPDAPVPPRTVTVTYDRLALDAPGGPSVTLVDPPTFAVRRLDGTEIPFTRTSVGAYEFTTDAGTYVIDASTEFASAELQAGGPTVHLRERVLGRVARTPPPAGTILAFDAIPLPESKPQFIVYTTGTWAQGTADGSMTQVPYDRLTAHTGALGMIDTTRGDALFLLEYGSIPDTDTATLRRQIIGYLRSTQPIVPGGTTTISDQLRSTKAVQCMALTAARDDELARLESVVPSSFGVPNADWSISAIPHESMHPVGAQLVAQHVNTAATDRAEIKFENPLSAWTIASLGARLQRSFMLPGATVATDLVYDVRTFNAPIENLASECVEETLAAGRTGIVDSISVDGKAITRDNLTVSASASKPVEITWSPTDGDIDFYAVQLVEMELAPQNESTNVLTVQTPRRLVITTNTRAVIPRSALVAGHYYSISIATNSGFPGAADGDFAMTSYPRGIAHAVSGVFRAE